MEEVTIYISGHGGENFNSSYKQNPDVYLMSFVGVPGLTSTMHRCALAEEPPSTIAQLELIKDSFVKVWKSRNHDRIKYPEQSKPPID